MSDKGPKEIRKQVRNVAKEMLPEILSQELLRALHSEITKNLEKRLDAIAAHLKTVLDSVDERSKSIQSYVLRNSTAYAPDPAVAVDKAVDKQ